MIRFRLNFLHYIHYICPFHNFLRKLMFYNETKNGIVPLSQIGWWIGVIVNKNGKIKHQEYERKSIQQFKTCHQIKK